VTGRLVLAPGGACQPPPAVFGRILGGLSQGEAEWMLTGISVCHPEAFEEALQDLQRFRDRRARREAAARGGAR
jgi:hypothetical protein